MGIKARELRKMARDSNFKLSRRIIRKKDIANVLRNSTAVADFLSKMNRNAVINVLEEGLVSMDILSYFVLDCAERVIDSYVDKGGVVDLLVHDAIDVKRIYLMSLEDDELDYEELKLRLREVVKGLTELRKKEKFMYGSILNLMINAISIYPNSIAVYLVFKVIFQSRFLKGESALEAKWQCLRLGKWLVHYEKHARLEHGKLGSFYKIVDSRFLKEEWLGREISGKIET